MKSLLLVALFCTFSAGAQTVVKGTVLGKVAIEGRPSFFFKVHGSGKLISYTLAKDPTRPAAEGTNHVLDVATGADHIIPGPWDPVFVGNTELMILPRGRTGSIVYEAREIKRLLNADEKSHLGDVPYVSGLYQSVGVLARLNGKLYGRLIAEDGAQNHTVKDFMYDSETDSISLVNHIESNPVSHLCPNVRLKLPMLSKDGHFLGGIDVATRKSAIWKIEQDYTCTKVRDLPLKTGKLNFNYDSTKVTYHLYAQPVQAAEDGSENYVAIPSDDFVSDIFVLDLKTDRTVRVTANKDGNSMYPDFTADGRLVFITHPHDDAKKVNFSFIKL